MKETVRIRAVGDNLIHKQLYQAAALEQGGYCFDSMFAHIRESVAEADLSIINQETILVDNENMVSSFPSFGSPLQVGEAVVKAGFQVVTHASNHALDKGMAGINASLSFWKKQSSKICVLGIHNSKEEQWKTPVMEVNGIKIAMLNFTEKLNCHRLPLKASFCVDVMKPGRRSAIRKRIEHARKEADFVIVFPHWGCEYLYEPGASQKKWASFFSNCGADLIVGTHPHVVQPPEYLMTEDKRKVLCIYSLGNYISCQVKKGTMLGVMADIVIEKKDGKTRIVSDSLLPLVTHTDASYSFFTTYLLSDYSDELAMENKIFRQVKRIYGTDVNMSYLNRLFCDIQNGKAQTYNEFQSPADVMFSNIKGLLHTLTGKNVKG